MWWTTLTEIKLIRRFPEMLEIDPTFKTNKHNWPWCFLVGCNSDKKTLLWGSALLGTGELTLTFAWLLLGLSQVYGSVVMQAVALTTSDGDEKIYKPIDSAIKTKVLGGRRARCIHVCIYVCTYV